MHGEHICWQRISQTRWNQPPLIVAIQSEEHGIVPVIQMYTPLEVPTG